MAEDAPSIGDIYRGRKMKGRGWPRKGSADLTYAELGLTCQQVWEWRKLAEIPHDDFEGYLDQCRREGKKTSVRGVLVHFGKRNIVVSDAIFSDTPTGDLANHLLKGFERVLPLMTPHQRRWVIRAMNTA